MFNSGYKKEAISNLKKANDEYQNKYDCTMKNVIGLHEVRLKSVNLIKEVELYVNSIANRPKELDKIVATIKVNYINFENDIKSMELESKKVEKVSGTVAGAGVVAGAGAFGPTAAMAIATTFGTASTGTAIATLSGAAATNAALAWLGGGALAVGGGGMSAGSAFLDMSGLVGWAIGGGGLLANSKNKKLAREAEESTYKIKEETKKIVKIDIKVKVIKKEIIEIEEYLKLLLNKMMNYGIRDYSKFSDKQLDEIKKLLNTTFSLSSKLCEKIN